MKDPIFDMKLHEARTLDNHNVTILRVHGGWIYYSHQNKTKDHVITETVLVHGVFVPYEESDTCRTPKKKKKKKKSSSG